MATEPDSSTHSTGPVSSAPASSQAISIGIQSSSLISSHATMKDWEAVSPSIRAQWVLSTRSGLATGWFWAHGYDVQARTTGSRFGPTCWLCCHCIRQKAHKPKAYVSSNTRNIEGHLGKAHNISHPDPAKAKWHPPERPPNQASLHGFTVKKRKADDFRDELAARFDKAHFQRLLVQWIADGILSFRLSEHEALHKMLEYLNPLVRETSAHLTHKTIRTRLVNEFHAYKSHVIDTLSRSPSKETFQPRKIVLGLPTISVSHTGENISIAVTEVLEEFELVLQNRVGCFILDNAANNDRAVEELGRTLKWRDPASKRIRCFGHVFHRVARAMLFINNGDSFEDLGPDDFDEWTKAGGPVGKLHNLVVWVHRSNQATAMLRRLQEEDPDKAYPGTLDVVLDNSTRWLSQYYMIERAITLRQYLEELIDITVQSSKKLTRSRSKPTQRRNSAPKCLDEGNLLTDQDWDALGWLKNILAMFDSCLLRLEGDGQVRVRKGGVEAQYGVIWQIAIAYEFLLTTLEKAKIEAQCRPEPSYYSTCINSAWLKLNKYYTKLDETRCTMLPQSYTLAYSGPFCRRHMAEERNGFARFIILSKRYGKRNIEICPSSGNCVTVVFLWHCEEEGIADEFERWLRTKQDVYTKHDNPLQYWSAKRFEYPRVAKMAIDILSIPAMAAEYVEEVKIKYTTPYAHEQNGRAEKAGKDIAAGARTTLIQLQLPQELWPLFMETSVYVHNLLPSRRYNWQSPIQRMFKIINLPYEPSLRHIHTWGCKACVTIPKEVQDFKSRARKWPVKPRLATLLAWKVCMAHVYKIWLPDKQRVVRARDVRFHEGPNNKTRTDSTIEYEAKLVEPDPEGSGKIIYTEVRDELGTDLGGKQTEEHRADPSGTITPETHSTDRSSLSPDIRLGTPLESPHSMLSDIDVVEQLDDSGASQRQHEQLHQDTWPRRQAPVALDKNPRSETPRNNLQEQTPPYTPAQQYRGNEIQIRNQLALEEQEDMQQEQPIPPARATHGTFSEERDVEDSASEQLMGQGLVSDQDNNPSQTSHRSLRDQPRRDSSDNGATIAAERSSKYVNLIYREEDIRQGQAKRPLIPMWTVIKIREHLNKPRVPKNWFGARVRNDYKSKWPPAMERQFRSLVEMDVWILVELPPGKDADPYARARWIVRGDKMKDSYTLEDLYAAVAHMTSVRLFCTVVALLDLEWGQYDAVTAFLNAEARQEMYMKQPQGFDDGSGRVCLLKRALYGLPTSPLWWFDTACAYLKELGFAPLATELCLFRRDDGVHILLYVDDMIIAAPIKQMVKDTAESIALRFKIKEIGDVTEFLGLEIKRDRSQRRIWISQEKFIDKIIEKFFPDQQLNKAQSPWPSKIEIPAN
ncbi:hAT family dimerization domain protein [Metarhizium robertsii]|uniref:HAT family dimerization domain protein n=1 Tax=Metarhizium robertsii TaxID=568076 RepID=A0A014QR26_9HYPO|nr:hAT family dimerization domain protein [Metarhizium robertsii]